MTEDGRKSVKAVVQRGVDAAELQRLRQPEPDPPIGGARSYQGALTMPGAWGRRNESGAPDPDEFPEDCPVKPLGYSGSELWLLDAAGQVRCVGGGDKQIGQGTIETLFMDRIGYAYWAWPRFAKAKKGQPPLVDNFRAERVRQALWGEAGRLGAFNSIEAVRGRGVWLGDEGELIVHCGDCLYVNGRIREPGVVGSKIYPRMAAILRPWTGPVDEGPAEQLLEMFNTFNWGRPNTDALLLLGWVGVAMFSGAMEVRPSIMVTGDKGRGKSTLQDILRALFGSYILSTTNTTPAGIYQKVNQDARPIGIDELENEGDATLPYRIVKLARESYSGGVMLRGGSNHTGVEFECRSSFLLSMINPPAVEPADLSRMGVLSMRRLTERDRGEKPVLRDDDELGSKIMRRMMDGWTGFDGHYARYREALLAGGHEERGCKTYGTLLACAHILLGDEGLARFRYPVDDLSHWSAALAVASMPEFEEQTENWLGCLNRLLTAPVDVWRGTPFVTVGAVLDDYEADEGKTLRQVNGKLAQVGLRLLDPREFNLRSTGLILAIPHTSPQVARLMEGSKWAAGPTGVGGWRSSLQDAPEGVTVMGVDNRVTISRATPRCTLIDLAALDAVTGRRKQKPIDPRDVEAF